jgi:hypothetical protein
MDELAGIIRTFTVQVADFTDNYFRPTGKFLNFE